MEPELAEVVQAIQTLYSPTTPPSVQQTLESSLQAVQRSPRLGWTLIDPFLRHPDSSVRFFGASTLDMKLSRQWHEVEDEMRIGSQGRGGGGGGMDDLDEARARDKDQGYERLKEMVLGWIAASAKEAYPASTSSSSSTSSGRTGERPVLRKLASCVTTLSLKLQGDRSTISTRGMNGTSGATSSRGGAPGTGGWDDWLLQVIMRIAASGATREATLEVLGVVIEQVARAEMTGSKRMAYMASLSSSVPHLVTTLTSSLSHGSSQSETNLALNCFVSFLNAGQLSHSDLTMLYPLLLSHLTRPDSIVQASSAVEELIERSNGVSGGAGVTKFMNRQRTNQLVVEWVASVFVQNVTRQAVEDARDGADVDDETMAVFKLVATLAEHFVSTYLFDPPPVTSAASPQIEYLTLSSPPVHTLLSLLITLSTFPGHSPDSTYAINELPTGTWMALQEYGADEGFSNGATARSPEREGEWIVFKQVWEALANGLRDRAVRPGHAEFSTWPKDIKDAFRVYRSTVLVDSIQYAYYVLRKEMLANLVQLASTQLDSAAGTQATSSPDAHEQLEATLFTLHCLSECISFSASDPSLSSSVSSTTSDAGPNSTTTCLTYLFSPQILGRLPSAPRSHPTLRATALKLVGSYSPWFSTNPSSCLQAVQFVVSALQSSPDLVPHAARALRGLCDANRKVLVGHVGDFVGVLASLEGSIDEVELAKVLESVASVVQALEPEQAIDPLLTLANPIISRLQAAVQGQAATAEEAQLATLQQLSYLSALAKGLSTPDDDVLDLDASFDESNGHKEAVLRILGDARIDDMRNRLGVAVEGAARVWAANLEVVSALSDFIRHSTSDSVPSPLSLDPLLLLSLCSAALQTSPSSIWLGIAGTLLARLARDRSDRSLEGNGEELAKVGRPVEGMLTVVLSSCGDLQAMSENPDVVAAFLSFCSQIVRHYPSIFVVLPSHYLEAVLAFAERGLGMQEQFSLKSTIELLLAAVQQTKMASASSAAFAASLDHRVASLVRSTLVAVCGAVPRSHLIALSELLHACLLRMPDKTRQTLEALLSTPTWPNDRVSEEAKVKFGRSVMSARTGRQVRQAVNDFALLARGLEGSAYGAATALACPASLNWNQLASFIAKVPSLKTVVIQFTETSNPQNVASDANFIPMNRKAFFDHIAGVDLADKATYLITFGEFRVGNPAVASYLDKKCGSNTYRVVHAADSIPAVVPRTINSVHHGRAFLLLGTTPNTLSECSSDEAPLCVGGLNFFDHTTYFVPAGTCGCVDPTKGVTV
ncbi:hypothetical protein JCM10212_004103 [Sporobolomyces blumeae]